jgi:NAD(P)-dependent dehydrogenase (short-subunit alcohol dehydrogenase family)
MSERPIALVTGASRGIGKASAIALAEAGCDVAVAARTLTEGTGRDDSKPDGLDLPGGLDTTAAAVEAAGGRALSVVIDLLDPDTLTAAAATVESEWGPIDVLVNNAVHTGPGSMTRFLDTAPEHFAQKVQANYLSQLVLIRAVLPGMIERGGGRIINMTSAAGMQDPAAPAGEGGWGLAYSASKAAFHRTAGILAVEHGGDGILCFNVEPGMVLTEKMELNQKALGLENKYPVAPPSVPASVVAWLATSDAAAEHNGETFNAQRFARTEGLHPDWR